MTDFWLARLLDQFAVELEVLPFVIRNSAHGIAQTIIREGMTDAITEALAGALEKALLIELDAIPGNLPLEGVHAIAARMFLARERLEMSQLDAGIVDLMLDLEALAQPHATRRRRHWHRPAGPERLQI